MTIPKILALDVNYNLKKEELEKTMRLNLNLNKEKFLEINNIRKNDNLPEISLSEVNLLIQKGKVSFENNNFEFKIETINSKEKELHSIIEPLLEIDLKFFNVKNTYFLHLFSNFNNLMENQEFDKISNNYKKIKENLVEKNLSTKNYKDIIEGKHKFSLIYKTLINEPLKQIKNTFLPSLFNNTDNDFYKEKDEDVYKNIIYMPENITWELPLSMDGNLVKVENIKYTLRYLTIEEINNNMYLDKLESEDYINKLGQIICEKVSDMTSEKAFEQNLSNQDIKENNAIVETNILPTFLEKNEEVIITPPTQASTYLLKLFFGINNRFFDQSIKVEKNKTVEIN